MGHHDHHEKARDLKVRYAVLTVSDSRKPADDASGDTIDRLLAEAGFERAGRDLVRDEPADIADRVRAFARIADLVVTTGGTGVASRDATVRAVSPLLERPLPGFGELFRYLSFQEIGPAAMMSAAFAGILGRSAVFCLPGSPGACALGVSRLIAPQARHLVYELNR